MKLRLLLSMILSAVVAVAQQRPEVSISQFPPFDPGQIVYGYNGADLIYSCYAQSEATQPTGPIAISAVSKAAAAVVTSTAHGFNANSRPQITISGATGTGWTAINRSWTVTVIDANTFSIPIDSTGFGTLAGTVTFTTYAPRTNQGNWAVRLYAYDVNHNQIWTGWLNGSTHFQAKCSDATSTTTNIQ